MNPQEQPKRIGKGMILGAWVLAIGLMTLLFQDVLNRQINPNRNPQGKLGEGDAIEVVLQRNRAGHYVASGRINGFPVVFLLDTGATDVALPSGVASQIGLELGTHSISRTAGGNVSVRDTRLEQVELGGIKLYDLPASVLDSMPGDEVLLGMSFLKHIEMTQRGDTLTLRQYR